jgi:2-haloacid dehalogenase
MTSKSIFANIKACVFDAYGTLFDVHSAAGKYHDRLGEVAGQVSNIWRAKQLEYTWLRSLMKTHADFWQVTRDGLDYALDVFETLPICPLCWRSEVEKVILSENRRSAIPGSTAAC